MTIEQKILISGIRRDMKIVEEVYKELLDKAYNEKTFHYSLMVQYPENKVLAVAYKQHEIFVRMLVRTKNRKLYDLTVEQANVLGKNTLSLRQTVAKQFDVCLTKDDLLEKGDE